MTASTDKAGRVLVVTVERDGAYGHVRAFASHISTSESCGFSAQHYGADSEIENLRIDSQCDDHSNKSYGWDIAYDSYRRVTLYEAQKAVSLLSPIHRKLEKMQAHEGSPASFGSFVNRVARAIGAVKVIVQSKAGWRSVSLGDAVYVVDQMTQDLLEQLNPQLQQMAA